MGREGPPFDAPAECGGLVLFMLVRLCKVSELAFRLASTACRGTVRGRSSMVLSDFLLTLLVFLLIAAGAGRGCSASDTTEYYMDGAGACDWRVTIALFWTGFFEVVFNLGQRADVVMFFNTYKQSAFKGLPCCLSIYGWQLWWCYFVLDFIAAVVLHTSGCHLGWGVVVAGPFGLWAKWYAFGSGEGSVYGNNENEGGTELQPPPADDLGELEAPSPALAGAEAGAEAGAPPPRRSEPEETLKDV